MDEFNEIYNQWVDQVINTQPLTSSRLEGMQDIIDVNQQIVNNIYNIRRYLEMSDDDEDTTSTLQSNPHRRNVRYNEILYENYDYEQTAYTEGYTTEGYTQEYSENLNNALDSPIFTSGLINNLFGILLEDSNSNYVDMNTNFEDVKVTLTSGQFDKLICEQVDEDSKEKYTEMQCNICMDEYKQNDKVIGLFCKHYFHKDCIKNWLCNERVTCPICRTDIRETVG